MPEANKIKKDEVMVDLDTSGPDTEVSLPEDNVEEVTEEKQEAVSDTTSSLLSSRVTSTSGPDVSKSTGFSLDFSVFSSSGIVSFLC